MIRSIINLYANWNPGYVDAKRAFAHGFFSQGYLNFSCPSNKPCRVPTSSAAPCCCPHHLPRPCVSPCPGTRGDAAGNAAPGLAQPAPLQCFAADHSSCRTSPALGRSTVGFYSIPVTAPAWASGYWPQVLPAARMGLGMKQAESF